MLKCLSDMKRYFLFLLTAALVALAAGSCKKDPAPTPGPEPDPQPEVVALTRIVVAPATLSLIEEETGNLNVVYYPADATEKPAAAWSSSDAAVATVDKGVVTAVGAGTAVITAKVGDLTSSCTVTVEAKPAPQPEEPQEWDGKTFIDRSAEWATAFVDKGGWWAFEITSCTAAYHLIKYAQEGDDWFIPGSVCHAPVSIADAYTFFCVNVDESYLVEAVSNQIPDMEELVWPTGNGVAHGYVFGFNKDKKFTGEYAYLQSEQSF